MEESGSSTLADSVQPGPKVPSFLRGPKGPKRTVAKLERSPDKVPSFPYGIVLDASSSGVLGALPMYVPRANVCFAVFGIWE